MKDNLLKKGLVFGIICVFICTSIGPLIEYVQADEIGYDVATGLLSTPSIEYSARRIARAPNGYLYAVYKANDGVYNQIYLAKSMDNGVTWVNEGKVHSESINQEEQLILVDSLDRIIVIWRNSDNSLYSTIRTGTIWSGKALISSSVGKGFFDAVLDVNDNVHVLYSSDSVGCYYRQRTNGGWQPPEPVSPVIWQKAVSITVESNGDVHAFYGDDSSAFYVLKHKERTSGGWSSPTTIGQINNEYALGASAITDNNDNIHVVWNYKTGSNFYIYYRQYTSSWEPTITYIEGPTTYYQREPSLSTDANNNLHVVWYGKHSGSPTYTQIRHCTYTSSWGAVENLTNGNVDQLNSFSVWGLYPEINGAKINRPQTGFTFIWNDGYMIKFYKSADLEWETPSGNQPPNSPTDLKQFLPDGTKISVGGAIDESTIVFKSMITDPDDDMVKLQVELRQLDELGGGFDETQGGFKESDFVTSSSEVTCEADGLIPGDYHWRARTIDEHGSKSEWVEFGNNLVSESDFIIVPEGDDNPYITYIEPESGTIGIEAKIIGWNLDRLIGFRSVWFGSNPATIKTADGWQQWTDTEIVVYVPYGEDTVDVTAMGNNDIGLIISTNSVKFSYAKPHIEEILPPSGLPGDKVTLIGRNFGIDRTETGISFHVKFGNSNAKISNWDNTQIKVEVPSDYGTGVNDAKKLQTFFSLGTSGKLNILVELLGFFIPEVALAPSEDGILEYVTVENPVGSSNKIQFNYLLPEIMESAEIESPCELSVYDLQEKVTGIVDGEIRTEIPGSIYDYQNETILVFCPNNYNYYKVVGIDEGYYNLTINRTENTNSNIFTSTNIPISIGLLHQYIIDWAVISEGEEGVTMQIDNDGDGTFEKTITSDNELTYDEFILQTETIIDIDPDTLNINSTGKWITSYIEFPEDYNVSDINISTIKLNDAISAETKPINLSDYDNDSIPDLMVKFDRQDVIAILEVGDNVAITVSGKLFDETMFEGTDYIKVI